MGHVEFTGGRAGIQEGGVNWNSFLTSTRLETHLRNGSEPIRLRKSFNTRETENIGCSQRGGTATVVHSLLLHSLLLPTC